MIYSPGNYILGAILLSLKKQFIYFFLPKKFPGGKILENFKDAKSTLHIIEGNK